MNYDKAREILDLSDSWTEKDLKGQYRKKALIFHPDKNVEQDTTADFQLIQEAYEFLSEESEILDQNEEEGVSASPKEYQSMLFKFLSPILSSDVFQEIKTKVFYTILNKITSKCEDKAVELLGKLDKKDFAKIYQLLLANKDVLHLGPDIMTKMEEMFSEKVQNDECVILNPFLEDLFENNLYKLTDNGITYLVPLWHHELIYDKGGADLYVKCIPLLPDNIEIDEKNNIHLKLVISLEDAWTKDEIEIEIGARKFPIIRRNLKLIETQIVLLANCGISKINTDDIYNVSKKSDIYIHVELNSKT
jgi:DnaJ-class molecular chaperone